MPIEPSRIGLPTQQPIRTAGGGQASGGCPGAGVTQGDLVMPSQRASEMKLAREALAAAPPVRTRRVAELKRQVQSGAFRVGADKVADKLVGGR